MQISGRYSPIAAAVSTMVSARTAARVTLSNDGGRGAPEPASTARPLGMVSIV
ncbi:MAG: hypothetical protein WDN25_00385 [Acetobacteraceae bacterium]